MPGIAALFGVISTCYYFLSYSWIPMMFMFMDGQFRLLRILRLPLGVITALGSQEYLIL